MRRSYCVALVLSAFSSSVVLAQAVPAAPAPAPAAPAAPAQTAPAQPVPAPTELPPPPAPVDPSAPSAAPPAEAAPPPPPEEEKQPIPEVDPHPVDSVRYVPKKGFEFRTEDKQFALSIGAWFQTRFQWRSIKDLPDRYDLDFNRARVIFQGYVWGEDIRYMVELGLSPRELERAPLVVDGMPTTRDALRQGPLLNTFVEFRQLSDLRLRVGQFKVPYTRQQVASDTELAATDRTPVDAVFNFGRDIGFDLYSDDLFELDLLRYHLGIYGGEGRNAWEGTVGAGDSGYLYNARLEVLPFGVFEEYTEIDFERSEKPRLSIGVAYVLLQTDAASPYAVQSIETLFPTANPVVDFNSHNFTADFMLLWYGLSLQSAFVMREVTGAPGPKNGYGFMVEASYLLPMAPVGPGAAFSMVRPFTGDEGTDEQSTLAEDNELAIFASYFFHRHLLKLQLEYALRWSDEIDNAIDRVRVQLQVSL